MKRRLIVIDDDEIIQLAVKRKLKGADWEVICFFGGMEALDYLKEQSADLIVVDMRMPKMDGDEFIEKLRTEASGFQVPVICATGVLPNEEMIKKIEDLGATIMLKDRFYEDGFVQTVDTTFDKLKNYQQKVAKTGSR